MSSNIWTHDALSASAVALETTAWRAVEAQHRISTMKLVDTPGEQAALERLIDAAKPPVPRDCAHLHYLLATPFRYAAENPYPSRFRPGGAREGVFYASAAPETAIAEIAFHRLKFFAESPDTPLPGNPAEFTAFAVQLATARALDVTRPPLSGEGAAWSGEDYAPCHRLAALARGAEVQVIVYPSARDPRHRMNYAVLTPDAFARPGPAAQQSWHIHLRRDGVIAHCEAPEMGLSFAVKDFGAV